MYYYKDHSADYLRRTGILMYRCSLFMLPVYLVLYILPLLDEFSPEQLRILRRILLQLLKVIIHLLMVG